MPVAGGPFRAGDSRASGTGVPRGGSARRHTFGSWAAQAGVDLYELQRIMGHSTPAMTQRYAHLAPGYGAQAVGAVAAILEPATAGERLTAGVPAKKRARKRAGSRARKS